MITVPSTTIFSFAPSASPLTVKLRPLMVWPASIVLAFAPENTDTAGACVATPAASVNVGLTAVAVSVGASFTALTVMLMMSLSVEDAPSVDSTVRVSLPLKLATL